MKQLFAAILTLLLSVNSIAAVLTLATGGEKIEKVPLASSATTEVGGETITLSAVGAGLRAKKVVFVNVKVYVGQLFVSSLSSFKKSEAEALNSLKDQKAVAIQLTFVRDVDADNIQKSFKEALAANNIDINDGIIKQFLETVAKGGEATEGKSLTILGAHLKDGSESIMYETTTGNVTEIKAPAGTIEKIFSIWLGKPSDDGVAQLKKSILK